MSGQTNREIEGESEERDREDNNNNNNNNNNTYTHTCKNNNSVNVSLLSGTIYNPVYWISGKAGETEVISVTQVGHFHL